MNEINVNDIVMWNLVYVRKRTFRRIDERPVYLFHKGLENFVVLRIKGDS